MTISPLPDFTLDCSDGTTVTPTTFAGQPVVLYLYPKDLTPGCTLETKAFADALADFTAAGFAVYGLSKDSVARHQKFCAATGATFPLISDPDGVLIAALGAWVEKSMFGKKYMGIDRSTFVFSGGEVTQSWRKVKVKGHVAAVLEYCQSLTA